MLRFAQSSETFQRLLFNLESKSSAEKTIMPAISASFQAPISKKSKIVIISNGVQQNQSRAARKRYVFSEDQISQQISEIESFSHQKKHIIKKQVLKQIRQKKQDPDYSVKKQKNDRNVISNIVHHLMKHVLTCIPQETIIEIFKKKNINLSTNQFLQILNEKEKLCRTYITNKHLKLLWYDSHQPQFSMAMRIISRIFLQNYSFLTIFNGNKLNRESKEIHYKGRRELVQFLSKLK